MVESVQERHFALNCTYMLQLDERILFCNSKIFPRVLNLGARKKKLSSFLRLRKKTGSRSESRSKKNRSRSRKKYALLEDKKPKEIVHLLLFFW